MNRTLAASIFAAAVAAVAVPLAACTDSPPTVTATGGSDDPRFQNVLGYLEQQLADYDIPGASIAIIDHGQLFVAAGVGSKRDGESDPVTPSTLFRVASLSKLVTASTALSLAQDGALALDQPITDHVPLGLAAGFDPSSVQLAQLLSHTAGIPDVSASTTCATGAGARAAWFAANANEPLWTPPGEVWNYSNRGYGVAGWVVEAAAGMPYEDVAAARVFGPAHMTTATFDVAAARAADHATGYVRGGIDSMAYEPDSYDCAATRPAAGVIASVLDYASLAQTLLADDGTMLTAGSVAALETGYADISDTLDDTADQYGYGLYVRDGWKGLHVLRHEGDDPGYQAALWMVPDQQFAVVVLYNASGRHPSHVAERAIDEFLGTADVAAPVETSAPASWAAYAGSYVDPYQLGAMTVTFDGNTLSASVPSQGVDQLPLTQVGGAEFSATIGGSTHDLTFYRGDDGAATWLVTRDGVGRRQDAAPVPGSSK